jgi:hypothetical protein
MEVTLTTTAVVLVDFVEQQVIIALLDGKWAAINLQIEANRLHSQRGYGRCSWSPGDQFYTFFPWVLGFQKWGETGRTSGIPTT